MKEFQTFEQTKTFQNTLKLHRLSFLPARKKIPIALKKCSTNDNQNPYRQRNTNNYHIFYLYFIKG